MLSPCRFTNTILPVLVFSLLAIGTTGVAGDPKPAAKGLEIHAKDHISIIDGTLSDRMQHDGWLETFLYSRFPKHWIMSAYSARQPLVASAALIKPFVQPLRRESRARSDGNR